MQGWCIIIVVLVVMFLMLFGIRECGQRRLTPYCQERGYSHGKYVVGYGGGSFCVATNGELTRVGGP